MVETMVDSPVPYVLGGFLCGVVFSVLLFVLWNGWVH